MQYVIVGNGIIALTTAFRLSKKLGTGDTITIVGPAARTGSATMAAAAMLNSFAEIDAYSLRSDTDLYHFGAGGFSIISLSFWDGGISINEVIVKLRTLIIG